jgi:hypothetical protein
MRSNGYVTAAHHSRGILRAGRLEKQHCQEPCLSSVARQGLSVAGLSSRVRLPEACCHKVLAGGGIPKRWLNRAHPVQGRQDEGLRVAQTTTCVGSIRPVHNPGMLRRFSIHLGVIPALAWVMPGWLSNGRQ